MGRTAGFHRVAASAALAFVAVLFHLGASGANALDSLQDFESVSWDGAVDGDGVGWQNAAGDGNGLYPDWVRGTTTPSGMTGPVMDHTVGAGGYFIFTETSHDGAPGDWWGVDSIGLSVPSFGTRPIVSFWYHMFGAGMGTLRLQISKDGGVFTDLWSVAGEQHTSSTDPWTMAQVDLSDEMSGVTNYTLRLLGEYGTSYTSDIAVDDVRVLTGDQTPEIYWRNYTSGENYLWYMNGPEPAGSAPLPSVASPDWAIDAVADFNGDGRDDLLWRNYSTGVNYLWYMDGANVAGTATVPSVTDTDWVVAAATDFNDDGNTDILWRNTNSTTGGGNYLWYMDGNTFVGGAMVPAASVDWTLAGAGDFNGDSLPDLFWRRYSDGVNYIWFMNGNLVTDGSPVGSVSNSWTLDAVGDYTLDGQADLLWRNYSTGENFIWQMENTMPTDVFALPPVDADWQTER